MQGQLDNKSPERRQSWRRPTALAILAFTYAIVSFVAYTDYPNPPRNQTMNEKEQRGQVLWRKNNCQSCHQLYGFGGFLGPELTNRVDDSVSDGEFTELLREGYGQMPALGLEKTEQSEVLAFLRAVNRSGKAQPTGLQAAHQYSYQEHDQGLNEAWIKWNGAELPTDAAQGFDAWSENGCGACHRPFTVGPNRAPDLSASSVDRSMENLTQVLEDGPGNMPSYPLSPDQVGRLRNYLIWMAENRSSLVKLNEELIGQESFSLESLPWFEY